jgi:hypothetical protein
MAFVTGKPPAYVFAPAMQCEGVSSGSSEEDQDNSNLLVGAAPSKIPMKMPALASSYGVVVEMNRVEQLETLTVSQYIDAGNRRVRSDVHDDGKVVSVIRDFSTDIGSGGRRDGVKYILTADVAAEAPGIGRGLSKEINSRMQKDCVKEPFGNSGTDSLSLSDFL